MKPITKQLAIAAFILTLVTALSFGIRQVRFSIHRARTVESADTGETSTSARSSNTQEKSQSDPSSWANTEPDYYLADSYTAGAERDDYSADSYTVDIEPDHQYAKASGSDKKVPSKAKSFKGGYAKSEGKKGLEKISLGYNENLYRTEKGELWYVSKEADGSSTKMQVKVDGTGDMIIVGGENYAGSGGSKGLQRLSVGDREDIYLTEEGQAWYVSEQPNGSTAKVQLEEDNDGEINIVDDGKDD